jgi:trans-aconitate 2-methyltransferase
MMTETVRDWRVDPQRMADLHVRWGASMLSWLDTTMTGTVLDAGCGSGRVTELLLDHLPDAHVVAVDSSQDRLDEAADRLAAAVGAGRVELVLADLTEPLPVGPVDAVLSTATLHWIADHERVFANLAAVLRPGGQLVVQCGGAGSLPTDEGDWREVGESWAGLTNFANPDDTRRRLEANGFVDVRTWLQDGDYARLNVIARRA